MSLQSKLTAASTREQYVAILKITLHELATAHCAAWPMMRACRSRSEEGQLVSSERLSEPISLWPTNGRSVMVPTPLPLWIFSSPILSGAVAFIGFIGLHAVSR